MSPPKYEGHYVKVGRNDIYYWAEGKGPPVVLIHGLACSAEFWQYNVRPLSQQYRVYAPDLEGFGRSGKDVDKVSLGYGAVFIANFMDALGIERASLAGNSMGGIACSQFAVEYPSRLNRLILADSAGFGRELHPVFRLLSIPVIGGVAFSFYQWLFPSVVRLNFRGPSSVDKEWIDGAAAMLRMSGVKENSLKIIKLGVDLWGQRETIFHDLHRQLRNMTAPTLIIWGSHDLAVPVSHAFNAQKLIPNSRVQIMDGCGHTPQVEQPEEFNQLLLDFLSEGD